MNLNRVLTTGLLQWLSWVFATKERQKDQFCHAGGCVGQGNTRVYVGNTRSNVHDSTLSARVRANINQCLEHKKPESRCENERKEFSPFWSVSSVKIKKIKKFYNDVPASKFFLPFPLSVFVFLLKLHMNCCTYIETRPHPDIVCTPQLALPISSSSHVYCLCLLSGVLYLYSLFLIL